MIKLNIDNDELRFLLTHQKWDDIFNINNIETNQTLYDSFIKRREDYHPFFHNILAAFGTSILEPNDIKINRRSRAGQSFLTFAQEIIMRRLYIKWGIK